MAYPCPLLLNSFWNLGFLLGITIILQIITGIFLGLHYTSDSHGPVFIFPFVFPFSFPSSNFPIYNFFLSISYFL
jgi:quinol-cytochrome oxidoreductase complex cytochrome b subunit